MIDPIFYAVIIAAIIYMLRFPAECHALQLVNAGSLLAHANWKGRHDACKVKLKGRYPSGFG